MTSLRWRRAITLGLLLVAVFGCARRTPPVNGEAAPPLKIVDLEQTPQTLDLTEEPLVLVQFWAVACCADQLPDTAKVQTAYAEDGLLTIAVNAGNSREELEEILAERAWPFEIVTDPIFLAVNTYEVKGVPTTFLLRDGLIVWRHDGNLSAEAMGQKIAEAQGIQPRSFL